MKFQGLYFNPLKTYDANLKYAANYNIKKKKKLKTAVSYISSYDVAYIR